MWLMPGVNEILDRESRGPIDCSHRNDGRGEIVCRKMLKSQDRYGFARYRRDRRFQFRNVGRRNFCRARRKEVSRGGNGSSAPHSNRRTNDNHHRWRRRTAQRKCRDFKKPGRDRVARWRGRNALYARRPGTEEAVSENEKPERDLFANSLS